MTVWVLGGPLVVVVIAVVTWEALVKPVIIIVAEDDVFDTGDQE